MSLTDDVAAYSMATSQFLHDAQHVNDDNLDRHVDGGWSARQIIHHVADTEAQSYARLRRLLAEPAGSVIQGYDEARGPNSAARVPRTANRAFARGLQRRSTQRHATSLGPRRDADFERYGEPTESGRYTSPTWLEVYTPPSSAHAAQLLEAMNS